jgi:hypothetical protein
MDWSASPCDDWTAKKHRDIAKIVSGDRKFCSGLLSATFQYPEYQTSQFSESEASMIAFSVTGDRRLARTVDLLELDVDNDGRSETILHILLAAPNWRACDYPVYVQLNESGTEMKAGSSLNNLMRTPSNCPDSFQPFIYRGNVYFEFRQQKPGRFQPNLLKEVLIIKDGALHSVCKFSY